MPGRQLSVDRGPTTVTVASPRRRVVDRTPSTAENTGHHALSAVSRPTSAIDQPALPRPRPRHPRRRAPTPPTVITAVSTSTRSNVDDTRPHTVSRRRAPRRTPINAGSNSDVPVSHLLLPTGAVLDLRISAPCLNCLALSFFTVKITSDLTTLQLSCPFNFLHRSVHSDSRIIYGVLASVTY